MTGALASSAGAHPLGPGYTIYCSVPTPWAITKDAHRAPALLDWAPARARQIWVELYRASHRTGAPLELPTLWSVRMRTPERQRHRVEARLLPTSPPTLVSGIWCLVTLTSAVAPLNLLMFRLRVDLGPSASRSG